MAGGRYALMATADLCVGVILRKSRQSSFFAAVFSMGRLARSHG
jgi:hypothetical protein